MRCNLSVAIEGIDRFKTFESHESQENSDSEILSSFEIIKKVLQRPS